MHAIGAVVRQNTMKQALFVELFELRRAVRGQSSGQNRALLSTRYGVSVGGQIGRNDVSHGSPRQVNLLSRLRQAHDDHRQDSQGHVIPTDDKSLPAVPLSAQDIATTSGYVALREEIAVWALGEN